MLSLNISLRSFIPILPHYSLMIRKAKFFYHTIVTQIFQQRSYIVARNYLILNVTIHHIVIVLHNLDNRGNFYNIYLDNITQSHCLQSLMAQGALHMFELALKQT